MKICITCCGLNWVVKILVKQTAQLAKKKGLKLGMKVVKSQTPTDSSSSYIFFVLKWILSVLKRSLDALNVNQLMPFSF